MTMAEQSEAYDRGVTAGAIDARLAGHDAHFAAINGHLAALAEQGHESLDALHKMAMAVQRLADQAIADAATRVSTAEAVEKARAEAAAALESERKARVDRSNTAWSPLTKGAVVVGLLSALVTLIIGIKVLSG